MQLYIVSMTREARGNHDVQELTTLIESLPGGAEIVSGRNKEVMTVNMAKTTASQAQRAIPFARVRDYYELKLL